MWAGSDAARTMFSGRRLSRRSPLLWHTCRRFTDRTPGAYCHSVHLRPVESPAPGCYAKRLSVLVLVRKCNLITPPHENQSRKGR
jgi:hypothetical protein